MNVFLLNKSGLVVNNILADSVSKVQSLYPQYTAMQEVAGYGIGWTYTSSTNTWTEPAFPPVNTVMSKVDFLNLFGLSTLASIQAASATDYVISAAMTMLNATPTVDVSNVDTIYFINYLASKNLITSAQQTMILGS